VIDVRQGNDDDTLTELEERGGTPSVYTDQDDSLLSDDMQTMFSVREATDEQLTKAHELVLNEHPFHHIRSRISLIASVKSAPNVKAGEFDEPIKTFLKELIGLSSCYNKRKGNYVHCACVKETVDLDRALSYLANVVTTTKKEQYALFKELINSRRHRSAGYSLRIGVSKSNGYSFDLCLNSFLNIIAIGKKRFKSLNETRHIPDGNVHKNTGYCNTCMSNETLQSVVNFIQLKEKQDGEEYATRIIRTLTRNELRDEEKGAVDLPSHTTKKEVYEKFCFDRGWAFKSDNMGRYPKVKDYASRQEDDMFWPSGTLHVEVCSWLSFTDIWKTHCSNIRIRRPCNNTCGECTVFRNAFRYREIRKSAEQSSMDEVDEDDDDLPDLSDRVELDDTAAPLLKDDDGVG
jgi:hypothetical protein